MIPNGWRNRKGFISLNVHARYTSTRERIKKKKNKRSFWQKMKWTFNAYKLETNHMRWREECLQVFKARTLRIQWIRIRSFQWKCWRHPFRTSQPLRQEREVFSRCVARKRRGEGWWRRGGAGEIVLSISRSNTYGKRWWWCWWRRWWSNITTPHGWRIP